VASVPTSRHDLFVLLDLATTSGVVRGVTEAGVSVFLGIPYASAERFGAPQPAEPWGGVLEATSFGPPPPQSGSFGMGATAHEDEGWLTANVWSPDPEGSLPVMVWIQGGAYLFGTSGLPEYDGRVLARAGVVVVTFNYRVGLEGFGYVEGTPPNRGLLDQVAALEWVRANIGAFGGDPGRVTIFGQSAGGGSVAALLAMPRAAGLFRRAIAQSVPGAFFTPALAADVTRACAAVLELEPTELAAADPWLLPAAVDDVIATMELRQDRWGPAAAALIPIAPVIDGDILPTTPWQGLTGEVELMVGHTRDEQRLLTAVTGMLGQVTREQADHTAQVFAPDSDAYRRSFPDADELYEVVRSDWLFRMPSLHLALAQVAAGGAAYLYELTWSAPGMGGMFGACHGLDVPLVFGNLAAGQPAMLIGDAQAPEAIGVSQQLRSAWVAFASCGDPGWHDFGTGATRVLDVDSTTGPYPEAISREIWREPPGVLDLT
jgi:para-nitrobenzyl esterase